MDTSLNEIISLIQLIDQFSDRLIEYTAFSVNLYYD